MSCKSDRNTGSRLCASDRVKIRSSIKTLSTEPASSMFQPSLRFNCRHAPATRGGNGLSEYRVLNVTAGEHTRNVCPCRIGQRLDVSVIVEVNLTLKDVRVWIVADGNKQ